VPESVFSLDSRRISRTKELALSQLLASFAASQLVSAPLLLGLAIGLLGLIAAVSLYGGLYYAIPRWAMKWGFGLRGDLA